MNGLRTLLPNAWYVAAREYRSRVGSRSFVLGTLLLGVIVFAAAEAPVLIDALVSSSQTRLAVVVEPNAQNLPADAQVLLDSSLNAAAAANPSDKPDYAISWLPASQQSAVEQSLKDGKYDALLLIDRGTAAAGGDRPDLSFTLRTDMASDGRQIQAIRAALQSVVIDDRLAPKGSSIAQVMSAFTVTLQPINSSSTKTNSVAHEISADLLSTGLIVLIFMAIITYGTWVAMSVAEEKGSRVMELMLNAATPLQMLAGKVIGNGAAGLTQYGAVLGAGICGVLSQDYVHSLVASGSSGASGFGGLTPAVLAGFICLFILGFIFYSLLYAALGSLVSRQEDVQSSTSPLMMLIMAGYFMSIFALQSINETWVRVASFIPFFSPYLMLARISSGQVAIWEVGLAIALLVAAIGCALVIAARIYSAGVLLYGQRVGLREIFKAARVAR